MASKCYDVNICKTKGRWIYKNDSSEFFDNIVDSWKLWKEKHKESLSIRLGMLGEPTEHPDFKEFLKISHPKEYITDGRILGTKADPRRNIILDITSEEKCKVILLWSESEYFEKAYQMLKELGINTTIGITRENIKKIWTKDKEFLLISKGKLPIDKTLNNVEIIEYYKNILLYKDNIITTENIFNLKEIKND